MFNAPGTRLPLSAAQLGIWFAHQLDRSRQVYYWADYAEIAGPLDADLLNAALRRTIAEADILNMRFVDGHAGAPCQMAEPAADWSIVEVDFSSQPDPPAAATSWMSTQASRSIDLSRDRLFNSAVLKLGPDHFYWYWGVHHIVMDGFGMALITRRTCEVYRVLRQGIHPPEPWFGPLQELLDEEAAYLQSQRYGRDQSYWKEWLAEGEALGSLGNRLTAGVNGGNGRLGEIRVVADLPLSTVAGLREHGQRIGGGWPRIAIAAAGLYLHRSADARDVTLSLPVHRRATRSAKRTPCTMANVLPLRLTRSPGMTFQGYAAHTHSQIYSLLSHNGYRGERLRQELALAPGGLGYFGPVVNIVPVDYRLQLGDGVKAELHNVALPMVEDLFFGFSARGPEGQIQLHVIGSSAVYTPDEINVHCRQLAALLTALAAADSERALDTALGG